MAKSQRGPTQAQNEQREDREKQLAELDKKSIG